MQRLRKRCRRKRKGRNYFIKELQKLRGDINDLLSGLYLEVSSDDEKKSKNGKYSHMTGLSNLGNTCFMNVVLVIDFNYLASALSYCSNSRLLFAAWSFTCTRPCSSRGQFNKSYSVCSYETYFDLERVYITFR
jgi:uncharacterized UBP type Zn finger protein